MIRTQFILTCALLVLMVSVAAAAEPEYSVSAKAVRAGDKVTVDLKLSHAKRGGELVDGHRVVETTRSSQIMLFEGKRATLVASIGGLEQPNPQAGGAEVKPGAGPDDMESGFRMDVISIKGADKVLVTANVVEKGVTIWANATMVDVVIKPDAGRK